MKSESRPASAFRQYLPADYRKKTVLVALDVPPRSASVNSYWDGGSRADYTLYRDGKAHSVARSPGFPKFENQTIELQPGDVFVSHGISCGKPATAYIMFIVDKKTEEVTP